MVCRCNAVIVAVAGLTVLGLRGVRSMTGVVHGGACHAGFVTGSNSRAMVTWRSGSSRHLSVTSAPGSPAVALPEWTTTGSAGVVVGWAWAVALLLLVVAGEKELDSGGDEKEEDVDNRHGEAGRVQAAHIAPVSSSRSGLTAEARAEGSVDDAFACVGAMAGVVRDGCKASDEANVEDDGDESEESDAAQEERQEDAEDEVQAGGARHALNGLLPCWNVDVLVGQNREEVAVDTKDDSSAGELEETQASLAETEESTAECHG